MAENAETVTFEEFTELVIKHQASIRVFIRMLGVEADFVDDVAQEAFLTAYKRIDRFRKDTNFQKWVRVIVRNIIANERRKTVRRSRILFDSLAKEAEFSYNDKKDTINIDEIFTALQECLKGLTDKQYDIIQKRYFKNEDSTQLSKYLNLSPSSVRKALMKIRNALQDCIEKKVGEIQL